MTRKRDKEHAAMPVLKDDLQEGRISRREFLRYATLLGVSTTAAYKIANVVNNGESLLMQTAQAANIPKGGVLKVAYRCVDIADPHTYAWGAEVFRCVGDYLTRTDEDGVTHPALVESWDVSDDIRTWTLNLRKCKWHSGRDFVADDVVWNLKRVLDPATGSSVLGLMKGYMMNDAGDALWDANAIEKIDDHTVRMNLRNANVAIPEHLFHYPMCILDPDDGGKFGVGSNGTGGFELVSFEVNQKAVMKARNDYWGDGPYLDGVEFIDLGDDPSAEMAALASGQIHGIYSGEVSQLEVYKGLQGVKIYQAATAQTGVLRGQCDTAPFNDARIRKAMRLAVDPRKALEVAHQGVGAPAEHHHVAPVHPDYHELPFMERDIAGAKQLLADAGYPDGIHLGDVACKKDPAWEILAVQFIVEQWKEAGITADINVMPSSEYWGIWTKAPLGFTGWTHRPLGFMVLGLAYRSGVPWNESKFNDPEFDALLTKAEGVVDARDRSKVIGELETIMQERGPLVQPIWRGAYAAWTEKLVGVRKHPTDYMNLTKWGLSG